MARLFNAEGQLAHYTDFAEGGHFPAMEEPELLVTDIRAFFRSVR
jgi:pimeloyl-ACP methyl ester carboxylesterase